MATVATYISAAVARSLRNKGQQLAGDVELLNAFNRILAGAFAIAARVNPMFYGVTTDVPAETVGSDTRWPFPSDANLIFYLQHLGVTLDEVAVVPYDDLQAETVQPAVYVRGRYYYAAGNALDPTGTIRMWYSRQPAVATSVSDAVDPDWPIAYDELLITDLALYLSLKDNRGDELAALQADRESWLGMYTNYLESLNAIERRRRPNVRRFNSPGMVPLGRLLTGGNP